MNENHNQKFKLIKTYLFPLIAIVTFIILLAVSSYSKVTMKEFFAQGSYYIITFIFVLWIYHAITWARKNEFKLDQFTKRNIVGIVLSLLLTIVVFKSVEVGFKTLSDETNLLAVSKSMELEKTIYNVTSGKFYYWNFHSTNRELPIRPLFFPYVVSLMHTMTGYDYKNPFILNGIILFLFLLTIFVVTKIYADSYTGVSAMFLALSYPILSVHATCAGFDLFSTFVFLLCFIGLADFLKNRSSEALGFTWILFVVLSHIRYESMIYFPFLIGFLFYFKCIKMDDLKKNMFTIAATPLMFLPLFWQFVVTFGKANESTDQGEMFTIQYFVQHFITFVKSQFRFDFFLPYANLVTIAAVLGLLFAIYLWRSMKVEMNDLFLNSYVKQLLAIFMVILGLSTTIFFSHYAGNYDHPAQARYFIILSMFFAFIPIFIKIAFPKLISGILLLLLSLTAFAMYHPVAVEGKFINTLSLIREYKYTTQYVRDLELKDVLVITNRPGQFTALDYGSVNFDNANKNSKSILNELKRRLFQEIIVIQKMNYSNNQPDKEYELSEDYKLETQREIQNTATEYIRISKVKLIPE